MFLSKAYYITLITETVPLEDLGVKCLTQGLWYDRFNYFSFIMSVLKMTAVNND